MGASGKVKKEDVLHDMEAISDFLHDSKDDIKGILAEIEKLEELEREHRVMDKDSLIGVNLKTQARIIEKLLEKYEFFQEDADINGLRVRRIAQQFLDTAEKAGLKELVKEKKKDLRWTFKW